MIRGSNCMSKSIFVIVFLSVILLIPITVFAQHFDVQPTSIAPLTLKNCQSHTETLILSSNEWMCWLKFTVYYDGRKITESDAIPPFGKFQPLITISAPPGGTPETTSVKEIRIEAVYSGGLCGVGGGTNTRILLVTINSFPSSQEKQALQEITSASNAISAARSAISSAKQTIAEAKSYNLDVTTANTYLSQAENSLTNAESYYNSAQDSFSSCRNDLTNFNAALDYAITAKGFANNAISYASSAQSDAQNKINTYKAKLAASASISNAQNALNSAQSSITTAQNAISQAEAIGKNVQDAKNLISSAISNFNKAKDLLSDANSAFASEDYYTSKSYADQSIGYSNSAKDLADRAYSSALEAPAPIPSEKVPTGGVVQVPPTTTPAIGIVIVLGIIGVGLFWYFKKQKVLKKK